MNLMILMSIRYVFLIPLTNLINRCLFDKIFPNILKIAEMGRLFKNVSHNVPQNNRQFLVIPVLPKVARTILKLQISCYLEARNLFTNTQFGFRYKLSTTQAILYFTDTLNDPNKAFDILLDKRFYCNFIPDGIQLIRSYLSQRKQYLFLQNSQPSLQTIQHKVPQGSILGTILFLLFINDLTNSMTLPL